MTDVARHQTLFVQETSAGLPVQTVISQCARNVKTSVSDEAEFGVRDDKETHPILVQRCLTGRLSNVPRLERTFDQNRYSLFEPMLRNLRVVLEQVLARNACTLKSRIAIKGGK